MNTHVSHLGILTYLTVGTPLPRPLALEGRLFGLTLDGDDLDLYQPTLRERLDGYG